MFRDSDGSSSQSQTPKPSSVSLRSSASSLGRKFTNLLSISRKSTKQVAEKAKNDYGLNTVYQPPDSSDVIADLVFVPTVWRTANLTLITKIRRNQDIIFVHQDGVIVIKNGLDDGRHISFS
ncbi:hypothetical protein FPOAC1_012626 [Fusarium poae]|jgi:hypothetical protein|uniref:hypothetical protein n=1 Tax=Fusarium poae TaxID=36050 RepID=UPI001CE7D084|nr:hypothetical protein FPOAC1_012626 [Fusarium poae]KAG8667787.1 hypothetical protein FPOAC1_012626 [Fusarium poae]